MIQIEIIGRLCVRIFPGYIRFAMSQSPSVPSEPKSFLGFDFDEVAYIAPMAAFLVIMGIGKSIDGAYPWAYIVRAVVAAALIAAFWKHYTRIRWDYWWLGIIMGVVGIIQWIGMDTLLQKAWPSVLALDHEAAFNPFKYFTTPAATWSWIAVRMLGASLVVPFMEELFWRDYLWRRVVAPNDFKLAQVGEYDLTALIAVSAVFSLVHVQIPTAFVWGLMVGGLLIYTRSLGACVIMHAVTNLLLGIYVLYTREWAWW